MYELDLYTFKKPVLVNIATLNKKKTIYSYTADAQTWMQPEFSPFFF